MTAVFRDIEGNAIEAPKGRTFAAIRKACRAEAARHPAPQDKDWQTMRAVQYFWAMRGQDTLHSSCFPNRHTAAFMFGAEFGKASDGSRRVVAIASPYDGRRYEIPHWDFVPTIVEHD